MFEIRTVVVGSVVDEGDRLVLSSTNNPDYQVVAPRKLAPVLQKGDTVEIEADSQNLGWFLRKK